MMRTSHLTMFTCVLSLLFGGPNARSGSASAADGEPREVARETREFALLLDGVERGKASMKISVRDDGAEVMQGDASLTVNYIVYKYAYASAGWEIWKDGRPIKVRNVANYNGEKFSVRGEVQGDQMKVDVNGKESTLPADAWPTSYWKLPAPVEKPRTVVLFDSDQGKKLQGELRFVGREPITVDEKKIDSARYRLTGDVQVELWYDAAGRLVRQESIEMGRKTVAELVKISRPAP